MLFIGYSLVSWRFCGDHWEEVVCLGTWRRCYWKQKNVEEDCWISSTFQASLKKSDIYLWLMWSQLPKDEVTEVCICNKIWSWTAVQSLFSSAAFENVENPQMAYSEIYFSMILPSLEVWYRILNSLVVVTSHHLSIIRSFQWSTFIRWLLKMYNWSETIFHKSNSGWDYYQSPIRCSMIVYH